MAAKAFLVPGSATVFAKRRPCCRAANDVAGLGRGMPRCAGNPPTVGSSVLFVCVRRAVGLAGCRRRSSFSLSSMVVVARLVCPIRAIRYARVSGGRRVWVGWIPAVGSDFPPCTPLHSWPKSDVALAESRVSCVAYLSRRHSFVPSSLVRLASPLFRWSGAGRTSKRAPRSAPRFVAVVARGLPLELSDAERPEGMGSRGLRFARTSVRR